MRKFMLVLWLAGLASLASGDDTQPLYEDLGAWDIHVDTTLNNGCFAVAGYEESSVLRVGFNMNLKNMYMILGDYNWKSLEEGKEYGLEIQFGNESRWYAEAVGVSFDELIFLWANVGLETANSFLDEFMQEQYVVIYYDNNEILRLNLTGSYKAGESLLKCQEDMNAINEDPFNKGKSSPRDPFRKSSKKTSSDPFAN